MESSWMPTVVETKKGLADSGVLPYLSVLFISLWAGVASFYDKHKPFSWSRLIAHLVSSSFAGMMTFLTCQYFGITGPITGVFCGVAAHMGTPAMIQFAMKLKAVKAILGDSK